jgi:DNA processing protein
VEETSLRYWVGFNRVQGIGPVRLKTLIDHFGGLQTAWDAPPNALKNAGLDSRTLQKFLQVRQQTDLDSEMEHIARLGLTILTLEDPRYPPLLKVVPDAPPLLYIRGNLTESDTHAIAVVGTRRATTYGKTIAAELAGGLARNGITVISGLALGIDGTAHRAALDSGGRTIAVLAHGLDTIYPSEHTALAEAITNQGVLISELPLGSRPDRGHFVPRNRLISGLSLGVVVVEASESSGAIKTADYALDQGREVFAVPGNASSPTSRGTNALIRNGAKMVTQIQDILEEIDPAWVASVAHPASPVAPVTAKTPQMPHPEQPPTQSESAEPEELKLLELLSTTPLHVDELTRRSGLPAAQVISLLTIMELQGRVLQTGILQFIRAHVATK